MLTLNYHQKRCKIAGERRAAIPPPTLNTNDCKEPFMSAGHSTPGADARKPQRVIPSPDVLAALYAVGRLKAIVAEYGVPQGTAWRWCRTRGVATTRRVIAYRDDVFDSIDSEHKAYVLGLLVSDGYIVEGPNRYVASLGSTDREIPEAFRSLVGWGRELYVIKPNPAQDRWQTEYRISVCSKRLVERLVALGVRRRKSMRESPVLGLSHPLASHFIRGVFDGDGGAGIYRGQAKIHLVGSEAICRFVREYLIQAGLPGIGCGRKDGDLWRLQCSGNNLVPAVAAVLYRAAEHWLPRKRAIFDSIPPGKPWKTARFGRPAPRREVCCQHCGKKMVRKAHLIRKHVFCSRSCWSRYFNTPRLEKPA
jgi:hypothetical protein